MHSLTQQAGKSLVSVHLGGPQVAAALESFGATGDVLEMAGGTGWWTARLARTAGHLTVIDSSPETLDLNRDRVGRSDVDYLCADLFTWQPTRTYDVVFFSFWLSHVPRSGFRPSGRWCGPASHRGAGCSSSTTAATRIQRASSRTPTSCGAVRILTCAGCTTEASTRSSRCSTSPRSCSRFWATRVGRQGLMQRAGSASEMRGWPPWRWAVATTRRHLARPPVDGVDLGRRAADREREHLAEPRAVLHHEIRGAVTHEVPLIRHGDSGCISLTEGQSDDSFDAIDSRFRALHPLTPTRIKNDGPKGRSAVTCKIHRPRWSAPVRCVLLPMTISLTISSPRRAAPRTIPSVGVWRCLRLCGCRGW